MQRQDHVWVTEMQLVWLQQREEWEEGRVGR
jgi:hypothetical protein